jgi:hypothetical protein
MPKGKAKPPENKATLTGFVDAEGRTLLVLAELRGKVRAFASEPPRRGRRRPGDEPPAPPAAERAVAWAQEGAASGVIWQAPRVVQTLVGLNAFDSALQAVSFELQRRTRTKAS